MVLLSVKSIQGKRDYMEDCYAYIEKEGIIVAMVCDGHGGDEVAKKTAKELPGRIHRAIKNVQGSNLQHAQKIQEVIRQWGDEIYDSSSGSTLTGIVTKGNIVYFYNIGDSRTCTAIDPKANIYMLQPKFDKNGKLSSKIFIDLKKGRFFCTIDHDYTLQLEVDRVKARGGKIVGERLNGILSVTRALGDIDVGIGLENVPDVFWTHRSAVLAPIAMYSDGLYEPHRYNPKANFNDDYLYTVALKHGADGVVKYAYENESEDNITAMLVKI